MRGWLAIIGWAVVGLGGIGCAAPPPVEDSRPRLLQSLPPPAMRETTAGDNAESAETAPLDPATRAEIDRLIADLESLGPVDEAAKQALAAELAATQPVLRRAIIQQHRALIAYRKQQAARAAAPPDRPVGAAIAEAEGQAAADAGADAYPGADSHPDGEGHLVAAQADAAHALAEEHTAAQLASLSGLQLPRSTHGPIAPREEETPTAEAELAGHDEEEARAGEEPASPEVAAGNADEVPGEDLLPDGPRPAALALLPDRIDDPQVAQASHFASADNFASASADDWQTRLEATVAALEDDLAESPAGANLESHDDRPARLRMLYVLANRRDEALRLPAEMPADEQEFWSSELFGLSAWLDAGQIADPRRRATEAARHLHDAASSLGALGNLQVRNVAFCSAVRGFGVCTPFERNEFKPREQVILYWEVENLNIESTPKGHRTALRARYQIFDVQGAQVEEGEFPVTEEYCQNRRRDYFVRYYLWMPDRLYDGRYTLKLTVEDDLNGNVGQGSLEFTVRAR